MRVRPRQWLFGAGVVAAALFALNSVSPDSTWVGVTEDIVAAGAAVGAWCGAWRRGGDARRAWMFLAGAITCWVVGDFVWDGYALLGLARPDVSLADLFYLVGYPVAACGVVSLTRARSGQRWREGLLDAIILSLGATILAWQFLVLPVSTQTSSWLTATIGASYPICDVALLGAFALLVFTPGRRSVSERALMASFVVTLLADVLYAYLPTISSFDTARLDPAYPLAYALVAAAAWCRSDRAEESVHRVSTRVHVARFVFLGATLCTASVVAVGATRRLPLTRAVYVVSAVLLCVLVVTRFATSIREHERAREQLRFNSTHDELTGLVNRVLFMDRVAHALERARRDKSQVAVLYIDLDRFKTVNDTAGHHVGDEVLVEFAQRMRAALRESDTVGRMGGDEFVVLCESVTTVGALRLAERLTSSLAQPFAIGSSAIHIAASIGISTNSGGDTDVDTLLQDADNAMYDVKRRGGGGHELCDAAAREQYQQRRVLEDALHRASAAGELVLHYQPTVRPCDSTVAGFEALLRWQRADGTLVPPSEFIPMAEETGAIISIGTWVIEQACNLLANWALDGICQPSISINVSGLQFRNRTLSHDLTRALARTGADPSRLIIEITETTLLGDRDHVVQQLEQIRRHGIRVAIDDFGTGYSALSYLHQLPIDIIKIDRSLTSRLETEPAARTVLAAIVDLAHALGLEVVAEGAETASDVRELVELKCDQIQGFYYARPVPQRDAEAIARHGFSVQVSSRT